MYRLKGDEGDHIPYEYLSAYEDSDDEKPDDENITYFNLYYGICKNCLKKKK